MNAMTQLLDELDPDTLNDEANTQLLDSIDDDRFQQWAVAAIAQPRSVPTDSFTLHAPLELAARLSLIRRVNPADRTVPRRQIVRLVANYRNAAPPLDVDGHPGPIDPRRVTAAVQAGNLDEVDRLAITFCAERTPTEVAGALTDLVTPHLAAAGHGAILLRLLATAALSADRSWSGLARGILRELSRHPDWTLSWWKHRSEPPAPASPTPLFELLLDVPSAGDPGSNFIYPTMSLVEQTGVAPRILEHTTPATTPDRARAQLLRIAAMSMLQDNPDQAPYGWSHCLTMPQGTLGISHWATDPSVSVAVASTFVLGFRATQSIAALDPKWAPEKTLQADRESFLGAGAAPAAATMWWATPSDLPSLIDQLVGNALGHHDAHLVKYTLACLDAAAEDADAHRLYLAAAAYLAGWWNQQPDE